MSIQQQFAEKIVSIIKDDPSVIGLAVGGSWLANELDEFSDLDLILVTRERMSNDKAKMISYAERFGRLLNAFTGEHVGEPRLLICLYDDPLLHVDIKFLIPDELSPRIENPMILADTEGILQESINATEAKFPFPDYQWLEDRFWIWIHYGLQKIGRGEYFEAVGFLGEIRAMVLGPLLHIRNGNLPRGVRKMETHVDPDDVAALKNTVADYQRDALIRAMEACITLYKQLQKELFGNNVVLRSSTEKRVLQFLEVVKQAR